MLQGNVYSAEGFALLSIGGLNKLLNHLLYINVSSFLYRTSADGGSAGENRAGVAVAAVV